MKHRGMKRPAVWIVFLLAVITGCKEKQVFKSVDIVDALSGSGEVDCHDTVTMGKTISFPGDAGSHDNYKTEWWYYTGNLKTDRGRHFGYQLTFFRQALFCGRTGGSSKWRTRQVYFAHFAVTDTRADQFYSDLRMNRHSIKIAGAESSPFRVWIDDWQVKEEAAGRFRLTADNRKTRLDLTLVPGKPVILQGKKGFSRKGPAGTNASFYYSFPRLETAGTIQIRDQVFPVTGNSWFDHEWSTSALDRHTAGWDWFSAHLDDGRDLMLCRIRDAEGRPNGYGFGSVSRADGQYTILSQEQFRVIPEKFWKSPDTGKAYPLHWEVSVPSEGLFFSVRPLVKHQEHHHVFAYWEGVVRFEGAGVNGLGYIELTGY